MSSRIIDIEWMQFVYRCYEDTIKNDKSERCRKYVGDGYPGPIITIKEALGDALEPVQKKARAPE